MPRSEPKYCLILAECRKSARSAESKFASSSGEQDWAGAWSGKTKEHSDSRNAATASWWQGGSTPVSTPQHAQRWADLPTFEVREANSNA